MVTDDVVLDVERIYSTERFLDQHGAANNSCDTYIETYIMYSRNLSTYNYVNILHKLEM